MKYTVLTIAVLTTSAVCIPDVARAGHNVVPSIHRDYQLRRQELDRLYRAERDAIRYDFERNRDLLRAELDRVVHSRCEHRHEEIRHISRKLSYLSREYGNSLRELSEAFAYQRKMLRRQREQALHEARYTHAAPTVHPVTHIGPHSSCGPDCSCHHGQHENAIYEQARGFDWSDLVMGLLANRLNR